MLQLLLDEGFESFREARYQLDFSQRQANGKFSRDEAEYFIAVLRERAGGALSPTEVASPAPKSSSTERALQKFSDEELAAELQRRGWIVAQG